MTTLQAQQIPEISARAHGNWSTALARSRVDAAIAKCDRSIRRDVRKGVEDVRQVSRRQVRDQDVFVAHSPGGQVTNYALQRRRGICSRLSTQAGGSEDHSTERNDRKANQMLNCAHDSESKRVLNMQAEIGRGNTRKRRARYNLLLLVLSQSRKLRARAVDTAFDPFTSRF